MKFSNFLIDEPGRENFLKKWEKSSRNDLKNSQSEKKAKIFRLKDLTQSWTAYIIKKMINILTHFSENLEHQT